MRILYLLCLLLISVHAVFAQQYNFRSWTLADGLPQSKINDILQDHKMQIWVATRGGISRFDGNAFHTYTKQQGLASNNTTCLFQDSRKNIWVGSVDNGLSRFDGASFTIYSTNAGLPIAGITCITEDKLGKLWVATDSGIYTLAGSKFIKAPDFPVTAYKVIYTDPEGRLWAGSKTAGLYKLEAGKLQHFKDFESNSITALYAEKGTGKLWVGTVKGAAYIAQNKVHQFALPASVTQPAVSDFTTDAYGNLVIGLQLQGIVSVKKDVVQHLTKSNGLSSERITALLTDAEENLWLGTDGYGIQQSRAQWFLHYFNLEKVKEPTITALAQDTKGRVWFGTDNGDAAYMQNEKLTTLDSKVWPQGTALYSMWVRSEKDVWVSTSNGIWNLTPAKAKHYTTDQGLPANEVYFIAADAQDKLWAATEKGIAYLNGNTFIPVTSRTSNNGVRANHLYRDRQNRLWAGTEKGIYLIKDNQLQSVKLLADKQLTNITSITECSKGWLYFGSSANGLLAYHEQTGKTNLFTLANGLPDESIKTLYTDRQNNLWIGTNSNVLKVDLPYFWQTQKLKFRTYNGRNGFNGMEVSNNGITQTPDGKIWFGTSRGLTQYIPELDRINKAAPELILTDIRLFMKPANWKRMGITVDKTSRLPTNLRLPYKYNHISFFYHGISLSAPAEVKYKYMLTGHDKQWSDVTKQPFATFTNLPPGAYTFKLKAQNNDGYWTPQPLNYTFSVVPPLWRREWFIGIILLVATGLVLSVIHFRERSLVKMNSLLEMRVNHRTRMLERKHREKELLLQEVHHRVKNNLQIVISLLNLQARHVKDPEAQEVMQAIRSRVRSMALLHERLYRHDDLEQIDLESYFNEICESLYLAYGISEERISLHLNIPPIKVDLDSAITLGLIVNELISNALKYAFPGEAAGKLGIDLKQLTATEFELIVWDNGVGSPEPGNQQQSFGLQLVSSLSKKLNGRLDIKNINGTKAILFFVIPS
ncbi:two-component regulator propeller domain-containing protein [Pontibacter sp. H259]|uniref:ligand-binding sensor domain-containing protein n=1 Tax=Pontibacter sp. H259 TaxID=3133421 RepID=UPI0030BC68D2